MLAQRPLTVEFEGLLERRVRAYGERLNARLANTGDLDLYDLGDDHDLAQLVMLLCEAALDVDDAPRPL
jgi:hypothetical protein